MADLISPGHQIRLLLTQADAEALAAAGQVARGFLLLARELQSARAERAAGATHAEALARSWQACMDDFAERHGLKTSGPGPCLWQVPPPQGSIPPAD
jgi:hypothetical protein